MICHEFKGGTGTASRVVQTAGESFTVGALVQANYGARELLRVDGVPVGREIGPDIVPSHRDAPRDAGSIIVVLATDAPLLPIQCQRLARRATTGLAWVGGIGANSSGDIFLAFATGNHVRQGEAISALRMLSPDEHDPAVPGRGGSDGGSHPQRAHRCRDDDGLRRAYRARAAARSACRGDAPPSAVIGPRHAGGNVGAVRSGIMITLSWRKYSSIINGLRVHEWIAMGNAGLQGYFSSPCHPSAIGSLD